MQSLIINHASQNAEHTFSLKSHRMQHTQTNYKSHKFTDCSTHVLQMTQTYTMKCTQFITLWIIQNAACTQSLIDHINPQNKVESLVIDHTYSQNTEQTLSYRSDSLTESITCIPSLQMTQYPRMNHTEPLSWITQSHRKQNMYYLIDYTVSQNISQTATHYRSHSHTESRTCIISL